jgi:hypothetical protein
MTNDVATVGVGGNHCRSRVNGLVSASARPPRASYVICHEGARSPSAGAIASPMPANADWPIPRERSATAMDDRSHLNTVIRVPS